MKLNIVHSSDWGNRGDIQLDEICEFKPSFWPPVWLDTTVVGSAHILTP